MHQVEDQRGEEWTLRLVKTGMFSTFVSRACVLPPPGSMVDYSQADFASPVLSSGHHIKLVGGCRYNLAAPSPVSAFYWRIPPVFISVDWESFLPTVSLSWNNYALAIQSIVFSFLTLTRKPTFILRMPRGFRLLPPHKPGLCKWDPARSWWPL